MNKILSSLVAVSFLSSFAYAGALSGSVKTTKPAPKAEAIKMSADPICAKENAGKQVMKEDIVIGAGGSLANVFVYVKEGVKNAPAAPATPVSFDQKGCSYTPHVFGIRVGQPLKIINSDPVLHNVHSMAKANAGFNMGMATKGQIIEKKFTKQEVLVKIKCDVHGWMTAYVGVVDHPYFAVTDKQGNFSIDGLPAGEYTVEAVHEKFGAKTAKVTVTDAGGKTEFSF